jgi:hypothetical protein
VPTVEERIARLETVTLETYKDVAYIIERIDSGPHVPWDQSIRGKLHSMKETLAAADKLGEAAREVRRARARTWSRTEKVFLLACAAATAVSPYVFVVLGH